jgi:aspartokinase/homoserine dehydrogenase 1
MLKEQRVQRICSLSENTKFPAILLPPTTALHPLLIGTQTSHQWFPVFRFYFFAMHNPLFPYICAPFLFIINTESELLCFNQQFNNSIISHCMNVLKFGGTSVKSVENIKKVISIILNHRQNGDTIGAVVLSAMSGVTNQLIEIGRMAASSNPDYLELIRGIEDRHFNVIKGLIPIKEQSKVFGKVRGTVNELEDLLRGVSLIRELSDRTLDLVMSFGERLSCLVISECLKSKGVPARFCDARELIKTDTQFSMAEVDDTTTNQLIREYFSTIGSDLPIVTGFIGSTANNETTTLGRGGSDYTASILGAALKY